MCVCTYTHIHTVKQESLFHWLCNYKITFFQVRNYIQRKHLIFLVWITWWRVYLCSMCYGIMFYACRSGQFVTEQKRGAFLPATTKAKFMRQVLMQKKRDFILMLHNLRERGTSCLITHSLHKKQTKHSHPQQDQSKRQCPQVLLYFKVPSFGACRQLQSSLAGSLACSELLSSFRIPPGGCMQGLHSHRPCGC